MWGNKEIEFQHRRKTGLSVLVSKSYRPAKIKIRKGRNIVLTTEANCVFYDWSGLVVEKEKYRPPRNQPSYQRLSFKVSK